MADCLIAKRLGKMDKPRVVLWIKGYRYEGIVFSIDDDYLELWDDKRKYRKFLKVSEIENLEVKDVA